MTDVKKKEEFRLAYAPNGGVIVYFNHDLIAAFTSEEDMLTRLRGAGTLPATTEKESTDG